MKLGKRAERPHLDMVGSHFSKGRNALRLPQGIPISFPFALKKGIFWGVVSPALLATGDVPWVAKWQGNSVFCWRAPTQQPSAKEKSKATPQNSPHEWCTSISRLGVNFARVIRRQLLCWRPTAKTEAPCHLATQGASSLAGKVCDSIGGKPCPFSA